METFGQAEGFQCEGYAGDRCTEKTTVADAATTVAAETGFAGV
jgi:hypothetical protein